MKFSSSQERCLRYLWDHRDARGGVDTGDYDREKYGKRMDVRTAQSLVRLLLATQLPPRVRSGGWRFRITPTGRRLVQRSYPEWVTPAADTTK